MQKQKTAATGPREKNRKLSKKDNTNCSVPGCSSKKTRNGSQIHFHYLPKPNFMKVSITNTLGVAELVDRKVAWEDLLLLKKPTNKFMRVCSRHFKNCDYIMPYGKPKCGPNRLKPTAIPSVRLPSIEDQEKRRRELSEEKRRILKKSSTTNDADDNTSPFYEILFKEEITEQDPLETSTTFENLNEEIEDPLALTPTSPCENLGEKEPCAMSNCNKTISTIDQDSFNGGEIIMPWKCCIEGCSTLSRSESSKGKPFFVMPTNPLRRRRWMDSLKIDPIMFDKSCKRKICWKHFDEDDYFSFSTTHRLKPGRVPKYREVEEQKPATVSMITVEISPTPSNMQNLDEPERDEQVLSYDGTIRRIPLCNFNNESNSN